MDSNKNEIIYRQMEVKDLKDGLNCFTAHNLQESLSTLEAYYECDPKAFYVAINNSDNRIIGVCGAPVTTHNSGFLGLYGVEKGFQNRGIGQKLFKLCLKHINTRNCGLHAVPEKLSMYEEKAGFGVREGVSMVVCNDLPQNLEDLLKTINENTRVDELNKENKDLLTKIIEYDLKVHNERREKLLSLSLSKHDYNTFVAIDDKSGQLTGYGCIRLHNGGKGMIGPVYADNDTIAEVLIYNLIKSCIAAQTKGLLFMTISSSSGGIRIAQKLQITERDRCERNLPNTY
ncbi:unnamed protein product [Oppiella nova]|uniref:N-acetyltransferase domain-containing protein n=1 Tax=Oppiella nova TaxID=334625 RepID=A0A7R9M754_9ACAR|nr:unnamed protein product [Oppiella nova]CAG2172022.1 unnamed protein product [Oppiella nova]